MRGARLADAAQRVLCPSSLSPPSLTPSFRALEANDSPGCSILNSHFQAWGSFLFRFLRSLIHTWTTQSHNSSTRLGRIILHSLNLDIQICYRESQIAEFVYGGLQLYPGFSPLRRVFFNEWRKKFFHGHLLSRGTIYRTKTEWRGWDLLLRLIETCFNGWRAYLNQG